MDPRRLFKRKEDDPSEEYVQKGTVKNLKIPDPESPLMERTDIPMIMYLGQKAFRNDISALMQTGTKPFFSGIIHLRRNYRS